MGVSQQAKEDFWASTPDLVDLPTGEGIRAVFEAGRLADQSFSTHIQLREPLANQFQRMNDLGIGAPELPWPLTDRTAEDALGWVQSQEAAILARRSLDNGPPDPFLQTADELRQGVKERVQEAQARASRAGGFAQAVGGVGVGVTDPLNMASMVFGAGAGASLIERAVIEAGVAGTSQLGVEAASLGAKERAGIEVTPGGVAARVAMTAGGAAGLVGLFHGVGRVAEITGLIQRYERGVNEGVIIPNRETEAAAAAIQDHLDTVPPLSSPAAEGAHFKATTAAVDVLRSEDPMLRASAVERMDAAAREAATNEVTSPAFVHPPPHLAIDAIREMEAGLSASPTLTVGIKAKTLRLRETVLAEIRRRGGIDPESLRTHLPSGQLGQSGLLTAARRGGAGFDQWHATAVEEGLVPAGTTLDDFFDILTGKAKTMDAQDRIAMERTSRESGAQSGWSQLEKIKEARQVLLDEFGVEPPMRLVNDYIEDPASFDELFNARFAGDSVVDYDVAIAREAESPTPPVVEVPIDAPLARPAMTAAEAAADAEFRALAQAQPDLRVEVDFGDETLNGTLAEVAARLDAEEAELTGTVDCLLGGVA